MFWFCSQNETFCRVKAKPWSVRNVWLRNIKNETVCRVNLNPCRVLNYNMNKNWKIEILSKPLWILTMKGSFWLEFHRWLLKTFKNDLLWTFLYIVLLLFWSIVILYCTRITFICNSFGKFEDCGSDSVLKMKLFVKLN